MVQKDQRIQISKPDEMLQNAASHQGLHFATHPTIFIRPSKGWTYSGDEESVEIKDTEPKSPVKLKIRPEKLSSSRFRIFPNTTWKNGSNICLHFNNRLMPAYNRDVIRTDLLPLMDIKDFVWVNIKDYGLSCRIKEGVNCTEEKVCSSYVRVSMRPTIETLNYGLCENKGEIHRQSFISSPVTWNDLENHCADDNGNLYQFSTIKEDESNVLPICIGLVKLSDDRYIYMEDDCNSEHNFVCDTSNTDYAPAVEVLSEATPMYRDDEVEKAMTRAVNLIIQTSINPFYDDSADGSHAKSINAGMIVGLTVGVLVIVIAAGVFYRYVKFRKAKAYRRSVFRYETKKASSCNSNLRCNEITHLTLPEQETPSCVEDTSQEKTHDDVYYERRYEPLQRELVEACTKKMKSHKGNSKGSSDSSILPTYDPLRKDHFLKMGHDSSCSDGLNNSYEKYDPDSEELQQQTRQKRKIALLLPKKHLPDNKIGMGSSVSYLSHVKTLDDLDQYENSNSLQEKKVRLIQENGKPLKDLENEVKKLDDLDQYENYNLPPLPALPTKTRPKKPSKMVKGFATNEQTRTDCYENYDI